MGGETPLEKVTPVAVQGDSGGQQLSGSRCVAEGVDSLAKFTQLKSLGIDRFQGYLFSPPMRREHLPDLIRRFSHQRDPAKR